MKTGRRGILGLMAGAPMLGRYFSVNGHQTAPKKSSSISFGNAVAKMATNDYEIGETKKSDPIVKKIGKVHRALELLRDERYRRDHLKTSMRSTYGHDLDIASLRSVSDVTRARMQQERLDRELAEQEAEEEAFRKKLLPLLDMTPEEWLSCQVSDYYESVRDIVKKVVET